MNTLILYSSKYGCTADCAKYLEAGLFDPVTLADINNTNLSSLPLHNYDTVILGSSVYVGSISSKLKTFCNENVNTLLQKRVGIFLCCGFPPKLEEYLTTNFPAELLKSALITKDFGGEARIDKMKFMDRILMKIATKGDYSAILVSNENMNDFLEKLNPM